ncbi:prepilin peptidase [Zavarzinia sp. CC-PAN008]|uniref:prepilin peptidase n=1 Tax=Zavarzinia sp. CC-PAN008 TaxID=3243332 RepID=UPI003F74372A
MDVLAALGPAQAVAVAGLFAVLAWLSLVDLRSGRLPDRVTLPTLAAGLAVNAFGLLVPWDQALLGMVCGYGALWLPNALYARRGRVAFGGGDLKLAALLGAWLGVGALPGLFLVAFVAGTCACAPLLATGRVALASRVPFGPALALGGVVVFLVPDILDWPARLAWGL